MLSPNQITIRLMEIQIRMKELKEELLKVKNRKQK